MILRCEKLSKTFTLGLWSRKGADVDQRRTLRPQKIHALRDLDLEVARGEVFGLVGPNGAGKTTALKLITALLFPTRGRALLFDRPAADPQARRRVGYLPENPYFYETLRPAEFLDFMGRLHGVPRAERKRRADSLLERLSLSWARDRPLRKFSKGMLQRIGLAQALIGDPELVILDEPMSGLDPLGRKEVRDLIGSLRDQGRTIFFSSHILSDVELLCDRVAILVDGTLRDVGPLHRLLDPKIQETEIVVSGVDREAGGAVPETLSRAGRLDRVGDLFRVVIPGHENVQEVLAAMLRHGARIVSVTPRKQTLEDVFLKEARD